MLWKKNSAIIRNIMALIFRSNVLILVNIFSIISKIKGKTFYGHSTYALCLLGVAKGKENNTKRTHHLAVNKVIHVKNTPHCLKLYVEYILTAHWERRAYVTQHFNRNAHALQSQSNRLTTGSSFFNTCYIYSTRVVLFEFSLVSFYSYFSLKWIIMQSC